jgi:hypothetical protein
MDQSRLYNQFALCTVRLNLVNDQGTGFFVAPGLVLTCAHVVRSAWPDETVEVHWMEREIPGHIIPEHFRPNDLDLALLRVELADHPCVLLHEAYTLGDEMLAFGYPIGSTIGDPVTLVSEDWQRALSASPGQPPLKLKRGQVQPGLSGAPLLNRRTGGVCGIVRLTRDRASELGGRAVPTALILARYDFLSGLQDAYHRRDRTWIKLLGAEPKNADRNRIAMIEKVRTIWITGFLQKSLFHEKSIVLGLAERPGAVARPLDLLVRRPNKGDLPLPPGTEVVEVFDSMDQSLLILGTPGAGKTTLLLGLARDLLDRAEQDPMHPIPVVFPLSTWRSPYRDLVTWLQKELILRYFVPHKIAQAWVRADQILPLLDGLDEVDAEVRDSCVDSINYFRQSHGLLPMAITSRTADYEALAKPMRLSRVEPRFIGKFLPPEPGYEILIPALGLHGAILVKPLTREQVEAYLAALGSSGEPVRTALQEDSSLWDLLDSPLLLNVLIIAYVGEMKVPHALSGTLVERRNLLLESFIDQMLRRRAIEQLFPPEKAIHWLSWLASQMVKHKMPVFYIEELDVDWLPKGHQTPLISSWYSLPIILVITGLVAFPVAKLLSGPVGGLVAVMVAWLPTFVVTEGCTTNVSNSSLSVIIKNDDSIQHSIQYYVEGFIEGFITIGIPFLIFVTLCLFVGMFVGLVASPFVGLREGLLSGLGGALVGGLGGCLLAVPVGYSVLKLSIKVARIILRLRLFRNGSTPWNYVRFLDYAAERILLRKVGGGYTFLHRMLLEYFASQCVEPPASGARDNDRVQDHDREPV